MQIIGIGKGDSYIVSMTDNEWSALNYAEGRGYHDIPTTVGATVETKAVTESVKALRGLKDFRAELANLQERWNSLSAAMDRMSNDARSSG